MKWSVFTSIYIHFRYFYLMYSLHWWGVTKHKYALVVFKLFFSSPGNFLLLLSIFVQKLMVLSTSCIKNMLAVCVKVTNSIQYRDKSADV